MLSGAKLRILTGLWWFVLHVYHKRSATDIIATTEESHSRGIMVLKH